VAEDVVGQNFSDAIRPVLFETEYPDFLYAKHGATVFVVEFREGTGNVYYTKNVAWPQLCSCDCRSRRHRLGGLDDLAFTFKLEMYQRFCCRPSKTPGGRGMATCARLNVGMA
jgi:hypothetical protein